MSLPRFGFGLILVTTFAWVGCAQGSDSFFGEGGTGGAGGAGGSGDSSASTTSASTSGSTSSTSASSSASSTSGSTTASSSSGGPDCSDTQHLCGGVCTNNTPQTGCFTSVTCAPCASPPINASSTCSADGKCDFTCTPGFMKSGNACVCSAECCSDADCGSGQTCQGNTCVAAPCDQASCFIECFAQLCVGLCVNNVCQCQC